ncbi:MAG: putative transport system permease protein [Gaiellaceae bacterium]|nr:putative transport system permease protein [Gaiellaceae bacterium]
MSEIPPSRLLLGDLLRTGTFGLRTRRARAALSAVGIAIGIAAIVAVLGISRSSQAGLLDQLDRLGTNLLQVQAGQSFGGSASALPTESENMVARIAPVESVSSVASVTATVRRSKFVSAGETGGIEVKAARSSLLGVLEGTMTSGTFLNDATGKYPVTVLGSVAAQRLGVTTLTPDTAVWLGDRLFRVAGIIAPLPLAPDIDRSALIGYGEAAADFSADGAPTTIYVRAATDQVTAVENVLGPTTNPAHPEEVQVSRPSDALQARAAADSAFTSLLLGLGAVALLVGGVGIANVMVISVLERRQEIGVRRALGATRAHVRRQFLTEALALAAIGGVAGVVLGAGVTAVYASTQDERIVVPLTGVLGGVGASMLVGAIAGLYPAVRAARLAPTEALRSV